MPMAERYSVFVTKEAQRDIRESVCYIAGALSAHQAALKLEMALRKEIASLSYMPKRIKTVDEQPWKDEGVRRTRVQNYYIYFVVDDVQLEVSVIAVIYARRDQEEQMKERAMTPAAPQNAAAAISARRLGIAGGKIELPPDLDRDFDALDAEIEAEFYGEAV